MNNMYAGSEFEPSSNWFGGSAKAGNPEPDHGSGSAYQPNPELNHQFGSAGSRSNPVPERNWSMSNPQ